MSEQSASIPLSPLYKTVAGLDVHKASISGCILKTDENGEATYEIKNFGTFKNDIKELSQWLRENGVELCVMESTGIYWRSPYDLLTNWGTEVMVVNARAVKNTPGHKTDIEDCRWLATLARAGLLKASLIPSREIRELRDLARFRQNKIEMLIELKNCAHKVLLSAGYNVSQIVTDLFGRTGYCIMEGILKGWTAETILEYVVQSLGYRLKASKEAFIKALTGVMTPLTRWTLQTILDDIKNANEQIRAIDAKLEKGLIDLGHESAIELLETIPGVNRIGAMIMLVEVGGNIKAFRNAASLSSWAGMCPGNNESAGKRKSGRTNKGNPYLRRILCEIANAAIKTECYFREKYKSLVIRRGYKRTIIAIGHKILKVMYCMLTRNEVYKDKTVDFQAMSAKKNAPRWIKQLVKYNIITIDNKSAVII
jgi:transposase